MAGETIIQGDDLILSVYDGSAAYRPIACLTDNSFDATVEVIENQTKCDPGNVIKSAGAASYTLSVDGQYVDTTSVGGETTLASHDYLLDLLGNKTKRTYRLATGLTDTAFYYFTGLITDLSLSSPAGDNASFSGTIDVDGGYATVDPEA